MSFRHLKLNFQRSDLTQPLVRHRGRVPEFGMIFVQLCYSGRKWDSPSYLPQATPPDSIQFSWLPLFCGSVPNSHFPQRVDISVPETVDVPSLLVA